jgi:hypothetical protein
VKTHSMTCQENNEQYVAAASCDVGSARTNAWLRWTNRVANGPNFVTGVGYHVSMTVIFTASRGLICAPPNLYPGAVVWLLILYSSWCWTCSCQRGCYRLSQEKHSLRAHDMWTPTSCMDSLHPEYCRL